MKHLATVILVSAAVAAVVAPPFTAFALLAPAPAPVPYSVDVVFPDKDTCLNLKGLGQECKGQTICIDPAGSTATNITSTDCSPNVDGTWGLVCSYECS